MVQPPPPPPSVPAPQQAGEPVVHPRRSAPVDRGWWSTIDGHDHLVGTHPARWGVGDALVGLLVAQVANVVAALVLLAATGRETLEDLSLGVLTLLQLAMWAGYAGWPLLVSRSKGNGVVLDFGWRFRRADVLQGLALGVGLQLLGVNAIYRFLDIFVGDLDVEGPARELTEMARSPVDAILLVLIVAVGAPVIEELFFRGLLLRSLERRVGSRVAIAGSALVFAAVHFQVVQFPALVMFGLVAGWLTVRSGRLGPAIWTHVGFNAVSVAILLLTDL